MQKKDAKLMNFKTLNFIRKLLGFIAALLLLFYPKKKNRPYFLILTLLGLIIRTISAGTIHKNKMLSTKGIYSITRNPLYFGSFLIGLGLFLTFLPLIFVLGYIIAFFGIYIPKMKQEEEDLKRLFPTIFPEYKKSVPLFFPGFKNYKSGEFSLKQAINNKEYNSWLAVIAIIIKEYVIRI